LEYHVVSGALKADDLSFKVSDIFPLFGGLLDWTCCNYENPEYMEKHFGNGQFLVGNYIEFPYALVTKYDVVCSNGIVHIIDTVLMPELPLAAAAPMSIVETAQSVPELSSLVDALLAADLVDTLSGDGPFTVFAPTNDALALFSHDFQGLTEEQVKQVLEYHVLLEETPVTFVGEGSTAINNKSFYPLYGRDGKNHSVTMNLEETDKIARIVSETNAVTVTTADVMCANGVVHIVDRVLIPKLSSAAPASMSIVETAQATPALSSLVDALVQADLVDTLSGDGPFTVFAPTNEAFAAISSTVGGLSMEQLQHLLEYHVVSGRATTTDLNNMPARDQLKTLFPPHTIGVDLEERGRIRIVGETQAVTVTTADVLCSNGVVHIVNAVLGINLGSDILTV